MTLSKQTLDHLLEAEGSMRAAIKSAAVNEKPVVVKQFAEILVKLEQTKKIDEIIDMIENREEQWNTYRTVVGFIPEGESILDFGCARGDFERFYKTEYNESIEYIGIDMNKQLIEAGLKVYNNEVDIRCIDWFNLESNIKKDWCINVGSCDLRYDANLKLDDNEYMHSTLKKMYQHANKGIVAIFASDQSKTNDDGLINRNAGDILNWAQTKFGTVALDHTISSDVFVLIIYKK